MLNNDLMAVAANPAIRFFKSLICEQPMRTVLTKQHVASDKWQVAKVFFLIPAACLLIPGFTGCSPQQKQPSAPQDKPLAAFQTNLLQAAFDTATAIPVVPHIKDRSRAQEAVVTACFELDQPQRALGYMEQIGNWRRGSGYADYAYYAVQAGFPNSVEPYVTWADDLANLADQDWRRDRIKVRISQVYLLLGQTGRSEKFLTGVETASSGTVAQVAAKLCTADQFDAQSATIDSLLNSGNFDRVKNALYACCELFRTFYSDAALRDTVEAKIKAGWQAVPYILRLDCLEWMARTALDQADAATALRLVNEAKELLDRAVWPPEYQIPEMARLAALRFRAGDAAGLSELQSAQTLFSERQSEIIDIYKAEALVPVAESYQAVGDLEAARTVYEQAIEAAVENPNNRPRAEDLSAICLSMAVNGVEPDAALWSRIHDIQAHFGDPW
jgi:tetratricopeptide (TPR) repeat protein